jgi:hypothetical protein
MKPEYFKNWVGDWQWAARIGLFLMLLSALVQLGMFVLTQRLHDWHTWARNRRTFHSQ